MRIQTQDLIGRPLDWAVAKAEERWRVWIRSPNPTRLGTSIMDIGVDPHGGLHAWSNYKDAYEPFEPSTNPAQAWPIIERERIDLSFSAVGSPNSAQGIHCTAMIPFKAGGTGPSALIAAMRCYVASRLGATVNVPKALL